jgi:hypothetical protein
MLLYWTQSSVYGFLSFPRFCCICNRRLQFISSPPSLVCLTQLTEFPFDLLQLFDDVYIFEHPAITKRSLTPSSEHHSLLINEPQVSLVCCRFPD